MRTSITGLTTLLLLGANTVQATTFSYGFDGDFAAAFTRVNAEDDRYFFDQEDGELAFFRRDPLPTEPTDPEVNLAYLSNVFSPRYDQSWEVSIDVTLPLIYAEQDLVSEFLQAGLIAAHFPSGLDGGGSRVIDATLRMDLFSSVERALFGSVVNELDVRVDEVFIASATETVNLAIRFDAVNEALSAFADGVEYYSVDTDAGGPVDWGMQADDTFSIAIIADSSLEPVTGDDAIVFDNFVARVIAVPEPANAAIALAGVIAYFSSRRNARTPPSR